MNCRQLQESLGDHSVGLLDSTELSEFERHAALCADCARSVRQFRRCMELLDHVSPRRAPDDLWVGVRARLEVERSLRTHQQAAAAVPIRRAPWRSSLLATAAGFAAAAVVMISLGSPPQTPRGVADDVPARPAALPEFFRPPIGSSMTVTSTNGDQPFDLGLGPRQPGRDGTTGTWVLLPNGEIWFQPREQRTGWYDQRGIRPVPALPLPSGDAPAQRPDEPSRP